MRVSHLKTGKGAPKKNSGSNASSSQVDSKLTELDELQQMEQYVDTLKRNDQFAAVVLLPAKAKMRDLTTIDVFQYDGLVKDRKVTMPQIREQLEKDVVYNRGFQDGIMYVIGQFLDDDVIAD